jgi:hypothetical protein
MKQNLKKQAVPVLVTAAIVILAAVVMSVIGWGRLLSAFETSWRFKIGYLGAAVLLSASVYHLIRRFFAARDDRQETKPLQSRVSNSAGVPVILGVPLDLRRQLWVALLVIFIFWSPFMVKGPNVHVKIFDNLDSHVPQTRVLAESGKALSLDPHERLPQLLNGVNLSGVDSGYNILTWLFIIFPPFLAYAINDLLMRLAALLGMTLLLKKYLLKPGEDDKQWLIVGASLCFALLPFYPAGGLSIAGLPILLYVFLNIRNGEGKLKDYLYIVIFTFYSKLALVGVFVAIVLSAMLVLDVIRKRKINYSFLGGIVLLTASYTFTHFHLVYSLLSPDFVSFREEIDILGVPTLQALKGTLKNLLFDRVNVVSGHHIFVVGAAAVAAMIAAVKKQSLNNRTRLLSVLALSILATSLLWGFKYWVHVMPIREKFQIINAFDFSRFYWFNPFLWYIVFAVALLIIAGRKYGKVVAAVFIVGQVLFMFMFYHWEYRYMLGIRSSFAGSPLTYSLTYKEFYSEGLFRQIDQHIGRSKSEYRVISLGLHPGIAQYNGFYTLDIYTDVYTLEYKHQFRRIMEKELEKSDVLRRGFDGNAKRCFLLSSELHGNNVTRGMAFSRGITKYDQKGLKIKNLELNTDQLKAMGGKYIFSAVEIMNYKENRLSFDGIFKGSDSPWRIYLYKVL